MASTEKIRENRLRRQAERQGYALKKDRARDPLATDYGHWYIVNPATGSSVVGNPITNLDEVEQWLTVIAQRAGTKMSPEQFEALLLEVRNGANDAVRSLGLAQMRAEQEHEASLDDARAVWHAAEFALGMLDSSYIPKREALHDAASIVERADLGNDGAAS